MMLRGWKLFGFRPAVHDACKIEQHLHKGFSEHRLLEHGIVLKEPSFVKLRIPCPKDLGFAVARFNLATTISTATIVHGNKWQGNLPSERDTVPAAHVGNSKRFATHICFSLQFCSSCGTTPLVI
eukprot:6314129-Amphidinium_carterae.3